MSSKSKVTSLVENNHTLYDLFSVLETMMYGQYYRKQLIDADSAVDIYLDDLFRINGGMLTPSQVMYEGILQQIKHALKVRVHDQDQFERRKARNMCTSAARVMLKAGKRGVLNWLDKAAAEDLLTEETIAELRPGVEGMRLKAGGLVRAGEVVDDEYFTVVYNNKYKLTLGVIQTNYVDPVWVKLIISERVQNDGGLRRTKRYSRTACFYMYLSDHLMESFERFFRDVYIWFIANVDTKDPEELFDVLDLHDIETIPAHVRSRQLFPSTREAQRMVVLKEEQPSDVADLEVPVIVVKMMRNTINRSSSGD